mgnify:CR=1 FL=1
MREIKFRAWDKERKKMFTGFSFEDIYSGYDESYIECEGENDFWSCPNWNTAVLMEYIGLKDKNGKEIYEGDIVKQHFYNSMWFDVIDKVEIDAIYGASLRTGTKDSEWEVIGNIYENPELLEEK